MFAAGLAGDVDDNLTALGRAMDQRLRTLRERLVSRRLQLAALSPFAILARGYAIVRKDGHPVVSVQQVAPGERVHVRVSDGEFAASVSA